MSINACWRGGRRFKTKEYNQYIKDLLLVLPNEKIPKDCKLCFVAIFGVSSRGFDLDNAVKPFMDSLQAKYNFNDNRIYKIEIEKNIVKKGDEFISFELKEYSIYRNYILKKSI